eukprot:GILK01026839.1.p1 GENE.GILK01026839.1~~GILK01026839.1.p1  ORF type:complete len:101 (-),score=6.83 GILK01026839.1:4-306(-)
MNKAVDDLTSKLNPCGPVSAQLPYILSYAAVGCHVKFFAIDRLNNVHERGTFVLDHLDARLRLLSVGLLSLGLMIWAWSQDVVDPTSHVCLRPPPSHLVA